MATEEHKYLADFIKGTHATLREETQNYGPKIAWQRHLARKDVLQRYADSMEKLATTYWSENNAGVKQGILCRVEWVKVQCREYFFNGGVTKYNDREARINMQINTDMKYKENSSCENNIIGGNTDIHTMDNASYNKKISLLDVGSCYNPFSTEDMFDVTAVDLTALSNRVLKCDFLNIDIGKGTIYSDGQELVQLPENSFDAVVFSLFLEYLPCPKQRYLCCKKAYTLLRSGGVLFVISPDSKHVNANVRFMKSWRFVLSKLGFMRIRYEKLRHIHCMVFRKCLLKNVALRWADLQHFPDDDPLYCTETTIYIPQDFRNIVIEPEEQKMYEYDPSDVAGIFNELPFNIE